MKLEIRGISKWFGGFHVLDDVTLVVPSGALFGLIGPNGAGKSTLFSVISGFIPADSGSILLEGRAVDGLSAPSRAASGVVRTFQVPREFRHLTVRENLMAAAPGQTGEGLMGLFFQPRKVREEEERIAANVERMIAFLRLTAVADHPSGKLSGGQKKLLELGRALMAGPSLVLLDEPFAGVNPVLLVEIMDRIAEVNARDKIGFLIVEHNLESLTRLVPRLAVMDRGRVIAEGSPGEVLGDAIVREAYLGGVS